MKIYIDPEALKDTAGSLLTILSRLNENMDKIEKIVTDLGLEWQGQAEIVFTAKILFIRNQFKALSAFLTDYSEVIRLIAQEYEETEKQLTTKMEV